ncbi:MAG: hypothetical protein JO273_01260 [Methylobacteriaceae bacterium]|nr:hypothetical protein [Methylobacteriaceae bacterium]
MKGGSGAVRPMEGHGAYNRSSRVQAAGLVPAISLLQEAARSVPLPPAPQPLILADYGCSEGRNSIRPIAAAVAILRERTGPSRPISLVFTDLPENDFSALFQTLAEDPESIARSDSQVFACAIGRSYFEQLIPAETLSLGWSSWSVQWLSRVPAKIPDQVQAAYSRDEAARVAFAAQAADDWRAFLSRRATELRPGGQLVVLTMASDERGFGYEPLVRAMYEALEAMVAERFLHARELHAMVIPTVGRSRADFLAPFGSKGEFCGLALGELQIFEGEDRIWNDYERDRNAEAFGAEWARFSRASVFPSLASALESGGAPRSAEFFNRLEAGLAMRLAREPQRMAIPLARMAFSRTAT